MFDAIGQQALGWVPQWLGIDSQHLSSWLFLPLNLWLIWRLLRSRRWVATDPFGHKALWFWVSCGALLALLVSMQWQALVALQGIDGVLALVQTLTACFLMVRVAHTLFDFRHLIRSLSTGHSVMATVLRQSNLQRIMAAREVIGIVFLFVCSNAIYGFLTRLHVAYGLHLWASVLCLPPLILAFLWAIYTINLKFRREARAMMLQGGQAVVTLDSMEQGLAELAMRSAASQFLMREVFMSEVFRILVTCAVAVGARL